MPTNKKERIDALLVERGCFDSREQAKAAVMAGLVFIGTERLEKPGMKIARDERIIVKGTPHPYVGRGGLKLEKAIQSFGISLADKVMIDIGASTGGFTDCALQHGARLVYAIDVGTNQLAWKLRRDERVRAMEKTNFRFMKPEDLSGPRPDVASVDVSFISLKLILPPLRVMLAPGCDAVVLIKPQFEAGKGLVGKSGVVRDVRIHEQVLVEVLTFAGGVGFVPLGLTYSPIRGGQGNTEFLAHLRRSDESAAEHGLNVADAVRRAVSEADPR